MSSLSAINKAKIKAICMTLLMMNPDGLTSRQISEFVVMGGFGLNQRITPSIISGLLRSNMNMKVSNYMNKLRMKKMYIKKTGQYQNIYYLEE